ncbi:MAG: hypothetical protein HYU78_02305 [Rhodocyclales bacterium]|nr:hypothetical protein [Rhodocyclales bacterium]
MVNHPNRGWRSRWTVDLEAATATHIDGWVFRFAPAADQPGAFDGECITHPEPLTTLHMRKAARVAREAGDIWIEARHARH